MTRSAEAAALAILLVVTALCCLPSIDAPFTFDEQAGIVNNRALRPGQPVTAALAYRFSPDQARPLFFLSLLADARLSGQPLRPRLFRLTSLLLHLACGLVLYRLLRRLRVPPAATATARDAAAPGAAAHGRAAASGSVALAAALAGTAVFLLHPAQSESIIYIWGRSGLLSTVFSLAALALVPAAAESRAARWGGALVCLALALASKEEAMALPLIAFVWWALAEGRPLSVAARRAGVLAAPVVLFVAMRSALLGAAGRQVYIRSVADNILGQAVVTLRMIRLIFLPFGQTIDPPAEVPPLLAGIVAILACGLVAGGALLLALRARGGAASGAPAPGAAARRIGAGILVAGCACLLYWAVPLPDLMSERRLYLPMVGAALAVSGVAVALRSAADRSTITAFAPAGLLVLLLAPALAARARIWSDSDRLWQEAERRAPEKARPLINLGVLAADRGEKARAGELFDRAVDLEPRNPEALLNRALLRLDAGDPQAAVADLETAVASDPTRLLPRVTLGIARIRIGDLPGAEEALRAALEIDPEDPRALTNLAEVLRAAGRAGEAIPLYRQALATDPTYAHAAVRLGVALEAEGDPKGALAAYREYLARGAPSPTDRDAVLEKIRALEAEPAAAPPTR